jgi:hypothetical protein
MSWGLFQVIEWLVGGWLALVAAVILFQIFTGRIDIDGMLRDDRTGDLEIHRLQLLVVSLIFAAGYLAAALPHGGANLPDMPNVRPILLFGLIGSHGGYLAAKSLWAMRKRASNRRESERRRGRQI